MVKLKPQNRRKEKARRGKGEERTREGQRLRRHRIVLWTRVCVTLVVMRMCPKVVTMEVKEATPVAVAMAVDPEEDLGHPEGQVDKELPDRLEDQVEDPLGRLEAGHLEDLVDHRNKVRPCSILRRMACSTSRRHSGTWLRSRRRRSKWTMSEEA